MIRPALAALLLVALTPTDAVAWPFGKRAGDPAAEPAQPEPAPERQPEPADHPSGSDPQDTGDTAAPDIDTVIQGTSAPALLKDFVIQGRLIDDLAVVQGFLAPVIEDNRSWREQDQRNVTDFLREIGYHAAIKNEQLPEGGVRAVLNLVPVTMVRFVDVDVLASLYERLLEPVFSDALTRRLTLRPGSALALDANERKAQLSEEAARLAQFLRLEGFFESKVTIQERPAGEYASKVVVKVDPGPPYRLGRIRVVGNTAIDTREIVGTFRHDFFGLFQPRFSRQELNRDIESLVALYQKRGYPGVRVTHDFDERHSYDRETHTVQLTIQVRERRKIDVVFDGNAHASANSLTDVLTLSEEGSYDDVEMDSSADAIRRYYQGQGYFEANVTWERVRFGVFERIVFSIDEGPKLEIADVIFAGNQVISDEALRNTVKTRKYTRLVLGESGGYATSLQLRQDVGRIVEMYLARGYRDVAIDVRVARTRTLLENAAALAAAIAGESKAEGLYVAFVIEEGPQYVVERVDFEFKAPHEFENASLLAVIQQVAGKPFQAAVASEDRERIRRHYLANGYPRADIGEPRFAPGSRPNTVVIVHAISENTAATIGKIAIRGNFKTQPWVIRDEMRLREGQRFTVGAAERALSNLRRSGLFSAVLIDYKGLDSTNQSVLNVLVRVEERHDNLIDYHVGAGYSTDTELFTDGGVIVDNILGTGLRFDLRGVLGQQEQSIEGKLVFPRWILRRLTSTPFLVELAGLIKREQTERFGVLTSRGASLAVTKEGTRGFWRGWLLSMRYDFRQRNRDEDLVRPAGASDGIVRSKVSTRSSTVGPLLAIDRRVDDQGRPNPLLPAGGFRIEFRAQFGEDTLLGTDRFIKLGGSAQQFIRLGDRFLLSHGMRYDHGIPLGGDVALPEVERFFAGGDTTVRGFEEDRLQTEIIESGLSPVGGVEQFLVLPAGGNIRFIHNLELQVRVWDQFPKLHFPVASAIFIDTGLVTNSLDRVEVRDLRHSLGVALFRLVTPVGSLSIEYAVPLDPQLGDNPRGRTHVNFGFLY